MATFEELPYELIEALRSKNLLPFLELQETSCNQLTISVYENQKFRPIVGEWGAIVGIHLIPGVDRRPFTNESGDRQLLVAFEDIDPINGFKWESEWKIVIDESTDADGYEYAANWTMLHKGRGVKPRKSPMTYVRRRKWKRVMVIDLNLMARSLPYELRATVRVKPAQNGQNINWSSAYVEIFVNGVIHGNGMVSPPSWSKEFTLPFAYIDRSKEIHVVFSRTGIVQSAFGQKTSTRVRLGDIVHASNPQAILTSTILHEDKNVIASVNWKIVENHLFRIYNLEEALSEGQLKDMVLTEEKLSQRLKQKIIMLSLGLGSNCNGLIKEITNILTEAQPIVSDLDLMEILDDVNSVQGKNEFEKVIALLKDAEKGSRIRAVCYPSSIPWFTKYLNMHVYDIWRNYKPNRVQIKELINAYNYAEAWYHNQPNCLVQTRVQYEERWCNRINSVSVEGSKSNSPQKKIQKISYTVHMLMRGEIKEILLEVFDLSTYISLLRLLSLVKYFQSGAYNKQTILDVQYQTIVVLLGGIFGGIQAEARADFQEECFDLEYIDQTSESGLIFDQILPIRIPFEYIESLVLSHDHFLAYDSLLEVKLLGATSFTSSGSTNYKFRLEMNGLGGQNHYHDFSLSQDTEGRQPPSGTLNDSFRLFVSSKALNLKTIEEGKEIISDGHADANDPDISMEQQSVETAHINISARLGTVIPTAQQPSLKKSYSKRDSFFSMSSSSSTPSESVKEVPPSLNTLLPSVFLCSNRDYTLLGHTNIGLDIGMNQEKEMQIRLEKKHFAINFRAASLQLVDEELIGDRDVYGLIYLADMYGQPFSIGANSDAVSSRKYARHSASMYDVDPLKRTSRVNAQSNFMWENETLSLDSNYYPTIENAAFFLVEIFVVGAGNSGGKDASDKLIGECLVPVVYEELTNNDGDVIEFRPPVVNAIRLSIPTPTMEFHKELVGDLLASSSYCLLQDASANSPVASQPLGGNNTAPLGRTSTRARARGNVVKILTSLKAIHPVDCAWPAHFLVNGKNTLDATRCHVEILQEGLIIHVDHPAVSSQQTFQSPFFLNNNNSTQSNSSSSFAWTILQDCMERKSYSSDNVEVLIAYDHIQMEDVCALSNHMLYLAFKVRRKLVSSSSSSSSSSSAQAQAQKIGYRELRLELIVGPCLAEEMSAVICNRIVMFPMRNFLCQHITSNDRNQEEAFTRLVKMFQEGIYETISLIELASSPSRRKQLGGVSKREEDRIADGEEDSDSDARSDEESIDMINRLTSASSVDSYNGHDATSREEKRQLLEQWNLLFPSSRDSSSLKLLYLKLATLKLYLWYLIEQSPLEFSAERHYLDSSWILFDEMGADTTGGAGGGTSHQEDLDTLIFRINGILRSLEQEIRRQILRACRKNTGDISSILTKLIYQKYLQVITMLHEAIDYTVKAPQPIITDPYDRSTRSSSFTAPGGGASSTALSRQASRMEADFDDVTRGNTMYVAVNPQKKRDLIKFVIVNDDIFENFLNSILRSHRYKFNVRPLLSLCLEFEDLIDEFGKILDENILMWNTRTLRHFMSSRDDKHAVANSSVGNSSSSSKNTGNQSATNAAAGAAATDSSLTLPWDITTIYEKAQSKELFISSIPETIQIQLNVEIGLKKVTPNAKFMSQQSTESLMRIDKMNIKIAQAIARSYIALASEYEKVMFSMITQYAPWVIMPGASQEKDDIVCFIASIVNDCERISGTHIPQSIELFTQEYGFDPDFHDASTANNRRGHSSHMRMSLLSMIDGTNGTANNNTNGEDGTQMPAISFSTCLKAISAVCRTALNELTNQVIFSYDVKDYFLTGVDNRRVNTVSDTAAAAPLSRWRRNNTNNNNNNPNNNNTASVASDTNSDSRKTGSGNNNSNKNTSEAKDANDEADHTPLDILLATMTAFLLFASKHLNAADTERLYYLCCQKIIIRYMLYIRDYHTMLTMKNRSFWGRKNSTTTNPTNSRKSMRGKSISSKTNEEDEDEGTAVDEDTATQDQEIVSSLDREVETMTLGDDASASSSAVQHHHNDDDDVHSVATATSTVTVRVLNQHANSHNKSKNPDFEKMKRDIRAINRFYSRMKTRLVPHWDEDVRMKTEQAMSLNQQRRKRMQEEQEEEEAAAQQEQDLVKKKSFRTKKRKTSSKFGDDDEYEEVAHRENDDDDEDNEYVPEEGEDADNDDLTMTGEKKKKHSSKRLSVGSSAFPNNNNNLATIEENPFDKTLSELLKKLSQCLVLTLSHDWAGTHVVDAFLSVNFGMDPPSFLVDVNKYDAALEKFFRNDAAFSHFIPMMEIIQDENMYMTETQTTPTTSVKSRPSFFARARNSFSANRSSITTPMPSASCPYVPLYVVQLTNLACFQVKKFQNLFMKILFNGKIIMTSLRANTTGTPQWDDVVSFPAIPLSQCKEIKIELYGFRLRALKMRRQIYIGQVTIRVVDVLRSEIAHQQQVTLQQQQSQQQQQLGMGGWLMKSPLGSFSNNNNNNGNKQRGSDMSRLSISSLHRGIQALSGSNNSTGCVHTAWYTVVTKASLLSSLSNNNNNNNKNVKPTSNKNTGKTMTSTKKNNANASTNNNNANNANNNNNSYVAALSSRGPREDVDAPQIRLTLSVKPFQQNSPNEAFTAVANK